MRVAFRVDASPSIGVGHLMRCLSLAEELKKSQCTVHFLCADCPQSLKDKIREEDYIFHHLTSVSDFERDAIETIEVLSVFSQQPEWLVVDHYGIDHRWHKGVRAVAKNIMVIDDLADRVFDCELLLDQTYARETAEYLPYVPEGCHILTGSDYALLRPQFPMLRQAALERRRSHVEIQRILVSMGGTDLANITGLVLQGLADDDLSQALVIDVILGAQSPHYADILKQSENHPLKVNVHKSVSNMADMMLSADLAIGAGGTTSWERCCLGLPSLIVIAAANQSLIAENLSNAGAVSLIECDDIKTSLVQRINQMKSNMGEYKQMSEKAFELCSGNGVRSVVRYLQ